MNIFLRTFFCFILISLLQVYFLNPAYAQNGDDRNTQTDKFQIQQPLGAFGFRVNVPGTGCPGTSAEGAVQKIVSVAVTILFTVGAIGVLIFFLWGAVEWVFSGGDKEQVANARKRITNAMIGLLLLSLSYVILRVVSQVSGFDIFGPLQLPGFGTGNPNCI